jgi:multidrug efflux pump subunit AcrB
MNLTDSSLRNPYAVFAVALVVVVLGIISLIRTPTDLFPNTVPPQVIVITIQPGGAAGDVADKITRVLEKELNALTGLVNIASTTRDEVSSINVEFDYDKSIDAAVLDVQNAISRVRPDLPTDILEPRLYRVTDATAPLVTLALSPQEGSPLSLSEIRLLAENQIEDALLALPGIADVDVFGGHQPEVRVRVRRDALAAHELNLSQVIGLLAQQNVTAPAGTIQSDQQEYLITVDGEFADLDAMRNLPLRWSRPGALRLGDIADIELSERQPRSIYHGNGRPAIAVNVMRPRGGATVAAIKALKDFLPQLAARYTTINFEITDDQQPLIDVNVRGMQTSLAQAVAITVIVIFVFLVDIRAAAVVSVSIPISFMASLTVLGLSPYTLNMVTLSGLIISVGMVVDASVVVLENIYRHWRSDEGMDKTAAVARGTREISLEITAGMLTTVVVLIPVMFTGGYTQQVMRPLNIVVVTTLIASLLSALTIVPLMTAWLLKAHDNPHGLFRWWSARMNGLMDAIAGFYIAILRWALRHRAVTLLIAVGLLGLTGRIVVPLLGGELMPPMDTGISIVEFETPAEFAPAEVERVLDDVERMIYATNGVDTVSSIVGSEPGEISFGAGGTTAQSARIIIHLVDRTKRSETIWTIQDQWREQLRAIPGIRSSRVSEYGATPMATTKAPLDIVISGEDPQIISRLADQTLDALRGLPGVVDVRRSWRFDKIEHAVHVDPTLARLYGTSPADVADELRSAIDGKSATMMRLVGFLDIPIRVQYAQQDINAPAQLSEVYISTPFGPMPLRAMADFERRPTRPFVTREQLRNTIDITAVNRVYTIKQVAAMARQQLAQLEPPEGYRVEVAGSSADMAAAQMSMAKALSIGLVLLYILLMAIFKSFRQPITILVAIPFAVAGAMWGLLLFDKPMCMPAMMGFILLGGTIVNNSILLLGFILAARDRGMAGDDAAIEAVRLRTRPILMTTTSTVLGLSPLVFEMAVGLERMSPLGIVAACGLIFGTFLTMIIVPVVDSSLESIGNRLQQLV